MSQDPAKKDPNTPAEATATGASHSARTPGRERDTAAANCAALDASTS